MQLKDFVGRLEARLDHELLEHGALIRMSAVDLLGSCAATAK